MYIFLVYIYIYICIYIYTHIHTWASTSTFTHIDHTICFLVAEFRPRKRPLIWFASPTPNKVHTYKHTHTHTPTHSIKSHTLTQTQTRAHTHTHVRATNSEQSTILDSYADKDVYWSQRDSFTPRLISQWKGCLLITKRLLSPHKVWGGYDL